jgi:hypothetical protein
MNNELMLNDNKQKIYSSVNANTVEEKKKLYNALESCDVLLNDIVGTEINIKDFYIEENTKEITDDNGETKSVVKFRTILFDTEGKTYATGSYGIYNALKKICLVFGFPTWDEGVKVRVEKKPIGNGRTELTLVLV